MADIKSFKKGAEAAKKALAAAGDVKKATSFLKSFLHGEDSKVNNTAAALMTGVAVMIDIAQGLVGLLDAGYISGPITIIINFIVFTIWFRLHGVSYWSKSRAISKVIGVGLEELLGFFIPWVNVIIPATTIMVVVAIGVTRIEEEGEKPAEGKEVEEKGRVDEGVKNKKREVVNYKKAA